jgi:hypothetical protein
MSFSLEGKVAVITGGNGRNRRGDRQGVRGARRDRRHDGARPAQARGSRREDRAQGLASGRTQGVKP